MRKPLPVLLFAAALLGPGGRGAAADNPPAPAPASHVAISPPLPIGVEADVYCSGWIGDVDDTFPASIFSAELINSKQGFLEGDIVYINAGTKRESRPARSTGSSARIGPSTGSARSSTSSAGCI